MPDQPDQLFLGGIYRADARVLQTLAGPELRGQVEIGMAGLHIDRWRNVKLLMLVRRDAGGRLWAGQQWQRIGNRLCLAEEAIRDFGLVQRFATATRRDDGTACIRL